jgi:hypothetical protein
MSVRVELRFFYAVIGLVLIIPVVVGLVGAFGGLERMAPLFGVDHKVVAPVSLRSSLRAISFMFFAWVPMVIWAVAALPERTGAFRIALGCAFLAGFARLTGYVVEGYPGVVPLALLIIEIAGMPILLFWHGRIVRQLRDRPASSEAAA